MRTPIPLVALGLLASACAGDTSGGETDEWVVYAVLDTANFVYSQNVVGLPVGPQDVTADCPLGGTVRLFGETSGEGGTSMDLELTFEDCANIGTGYDVALTGAATWSGTFRSTGYKALATTSDSLTVAGTVDGDEGETEVDETCALAVTDRGQDGEVSVVSGEWCGREVYF
ncbi:MAG: hypothetical protein ACOZNI_07505 [Myxococcota bacterium]